MRGKVRGGPVTVRPGQPGDGPAVAAIARRGRALLGRPYRDLCRMADDPVRNNGWFVVGESGGRVVGYVSYDLRVRRRLPVLRLRSAAVDGRLPAGAGPAFAAAAAESIRSTLSAATGGKGFLVADVPPWSPAAELFDGGLRWEPLQPPHGAKTVRYYRTVA